MRITMLTAIFVVITIASNTLIAGELEERNAIKREVIGYFNAGDYKNLVQLAHQYRMAKSRTASGLWKLTLFYSGIHEAMDIRIRDENYWSFMKSKTEKWIKEYALHPTPYIAHGIVMRKYAWKFRGSGWAYTVPAQAWEPFSQHLNNAKTFLEKYKETASIDPTWYEVMAMIGIGLNMNRTEFEKIIEEGFKQEPLYYQLYFTALQYFLPKWHGSERDIEEFANSAVARTKEQEGMGMYARIYWNASQTQYGEKLFTDSNIVWEKMKKGIDDVLKRYPDQWNINHFALFACLAKDREKAGELFDLIKEPAILDVWKSQSNYLSYRFWAKGERATELAKRQATRENSVSKPIDNASISSSQSNKKSMPDGFIGLKWGHSLEKMKEEGLLNWVQNDKEITNHAGAYINLNRFNPYPNLNIKDILLFFYKDKLFGGVISFIDKESWNILSATIEEEYGIPNIHDQTNAQGESTAKMLRWQYGPGKGISSVFHEFEHKGHIQFYFEPKELRDELNLLTEKRQQQKK